MPFVSTNGVNLHYQELGQGPVVMMLHGLLLDNLALWYFSAASIVKHHRRALMLDFRGHGKSEKTKSGFDLQTLSKDLGGVVEVLAANDSVDICGFSYGCLVALRYAIDQPDRVRRLVLVDSPLPPKDFESERWLKADVADLVATLPEGIRQAVLQSPGRALKIAQRVRYLAYNTTLIDDIKNEPAIPASGLASLRAPTLCIYGAQSEFRLDGDCLSAALPNATLRILNGGHRLLNECAAEVTALAEEFLNG
jgi:pimeloyl-ACP methyl ester carboxylesterase